jgi:uncharacterized protein YegP (UPF0339 family)
VQTNCADAGQYECKTPNNDKAYFVLKAKNNQMIGQSEMYESDSGCENGMESVNTNGVSSDIKDLTES